MNPLIQFPSLVAQDEAPETDEAKAKAERIAFHRSHVKNGPAKFRSVGPSDEKRARRRALARQTKKAERAQRKQHFAQTREHAILRGHLQRVGVIAYETDYQPSESQRLQSAAWLIHRFVPVSEIDDVQAALQTAVQRAFDRFSDLSGVERSEVEYV